MVTVVGLGLQVILFSLLFIRMEWATGMNDTEWWAQSQPYDLRASSKNKILSLTAGGRNPTAAINPKEQDRAFSPFDSDIGQEQAACAAAEYQKMNGAFCFSLI